MTPNLPKPPPKLPPKAPPKALFNAVAVTAPAPVAQAAAPAAPQPGRPPQMAALTEAMQIFDAIIVEENALLRRQDVQAVKAMAERKEKASVLYLERLRGAFSDAEALGQLPPDERARMAALAQQMKGHVDENAALLRASMQAVERMFGAINDQVRQERTTQVTYSAEGQMDGPAARHSAVAYNASA